MKRLIYLALMIATGACMSSCGPARHLSNGYQTDEIRDVMLFDPVSKIEIIGKGGITVTDTTACIASQELLLETLKTYDSGLNIKAVHRPESNRETEKIRKEIENLYARHLNASEEDGAITYPIPENIDRILEKSGHRYGMVLYCYGFSRTGGNYATQVAKSVGIALLTLGSVYTVPYKDKSNLHLFLIDSEKDQIAYQIHSIAPDYNPLKPKHVEKQFKYLFKEFRK